MKILVVGGAGYVGCVLVQELLSRGYSVRVCDRLFFGGEGLAAVRNEIELIQDDMRHLSAHSLDGIDAVVNLGGISSDPVAQFKPELTFEMNVEGAVHLAQVCRKAGVRRYLFASSCSVYDSGVIDDESDVLLDETSPVGSAVSVYAESKLEAERRLLSLVDDAFCPVLLRKGTVFGYSPRMRFDLVLNTFLKDALSRGCIYLHAGGEVWRPVVGIRDAASAYVACLEAEEACVQGEIFNVVSGNFRICEMALRVREVLRKMGITVDIHVDYEQDKVRGYRVSGRKFEQRLERCAEESIESSVSRSVYAIKSAGITDFDHPNFYNMRQLEDWEK